MAKHPLDEAERLFRARRWQELISLLEPMTAMYRENARFSYLLGCAYLYRSDTGGAYSCFRRSQNLAFRDNDAAFGLAAVLIRRGETDKAVQLYIEILERAPGYRRAARALEFVRASLDPERGEDLGPGAVRVLYPVPPGRKRGAVIVAAAALACVALALAARGLPSLIESLRNARPGRPGIAEIALDAEDRAAPVTTAGEFSVVLTEAEALASFERAKALFSDYRDEAALVELNRLRLSNASRQIKSKAEALSLYVREPSFLSMPDRFTFAEVRSDPPLYEGVAVIWKGMPANIAPAPADSGQGGATAFDFLVGYHDMKKLEGIVGVVVPFPVKIDPDRPLEVLGRVRVVSGAAGGFRLDCVAVHQ